MRRMWLSSMVVLVACSSGGSSETVTSAAEDPTGATVSTAGEGEAASVVEEFVVAEAEPAIDDEGAGYVAPVDPEGGYATDLCGIDFDVVFASEDPLAELSEQLRSVPTSNGFEERELAEMLEMIGSLDTATTPEERTDIIDLGALVGARCE